MAEIECINQIQELGIGRAIFNSDSMQPTIKSGDVIEVDHSQREYVGDGVYCFSWQDRFGSALILRRVTRQIDGTFKASNDNDLYPAQKLSEKELKNWPMIGRVIRSFSESKH